VLAAGEDPAENVRAARRPTARVARVARRPPTRASARRLSPSSALNRPDRRDSKLSRASEPVNGRGAEPSGRL